MAKRRREDLIHHLEFYSDIGVDHLSIPQARTAGKAGLRATPAGTGDRAAAQDRSCEATPGDLFSALGTADPDLRTVLEDLGECTRCKLHKTRTNIVFGSGNPKARVMFVGEAPGADEDAQGLPFVGRAGQLLTKIIESIGFARDEVYITNILKCRPPKNRNPEEDEIAACQGFLFRQIAVIRPLIVCALGAFAVHTLLQTKAPISQIRGRLLDFRGTKLIATFHPAYLLRNPAEKRKVWEDVKMLRAYYDSQI